MLGLNMFNKLWRTLKTADLTNPGQRVLVGLLALAVVVGSVWLLLSSGIYGWTLFAVIPIVLGAIGAWCTRPSTAAQAAWAGMLANAAGTGLLLLAGKEGLICILMAAPL